MPRKPAKITYHFVETKRDGRFVDYNVEARQGLRRWTVGRISGATGGYRPQWAGLPIGASAWTRYHLTRRAAFTALQAREDFRVPRTFVSV
jgi:hypothetical protein